MIKSTQIQLQMGSGLDRTDNSKGYLIKNVVPCCGICNSIKGSNLTHSEMIVAMRAVMKLRNS